MENYFFDLDGTIINSELGIKNAFKHTFKELNMPIPDDATLRSYIGPSLEVTFASLGDKSFAEKAVAIYRDYYSKKGMFEAEIYPHILETVSKLRENGKKTYVATSKNELVTEKTFEEFNLHDYFDDFTGSNDNKHSKTLVLAHAMEKAKADPEKSFMIGDRNHDIIGGQENHVKTIGVLYGFGDREELEDAHANYIISDPRELLEI